MSEARLHRPSRRSRAEARRRGGLSPVTVALREARRDERNLIEQLLTQYLLEFDGRKDEYPGLDAYWEDSDRQPLLIEAGGEVVGLCLIRHRNTGWSIAEFWVQSDRRRCGVGRAAVEAIAQRGRAAGADFLEAKIHPANRKASSFWLAVGFSRAEDPGTGVIVTRRPL